MSTMVTRVIAIRNLQQYIWKNLRELADEFWISVFVNGKQNKWWKWLVLERCAWLSNNNSRAPNGLWFELKSVSCILSNDWLKPKETMAITMINPAELAENEFFKSHCWNKLKSLVFCAVLWTWHNQTDAILADVTSFDLQTEQDLIFEIKADYDFIREKYMSYGWSSLTWKDGKWIQARTKWAGHGSNTRAFYARKDLVKIIF